MPEDVLRIDNSAWVNRVQSDPIAYRQRQAVEIALHSIAKLLKPYRFYLKGGLLMGLAHGSPRQTTDIDLTAGFRAEEDIAERIERDLEETLAIAAADL